MVRFARPPRWLLEVAVLGAAVAEAWLDHEWYSPAACAAAITACLALLLRRRWPILAFLLTVPATGLTIMVVAPGVALFNLALHTRNRLLLFACTGTSILAAAVTWLPIDQADRTDALVDLVYLTAWAAAPALFGQLVRTRDELSGRLAEIEEARDQERLLHAQAVLARERAQIGREMHDVVSHQVSLIAVRAGALMVSARDADTREAAETIRMLSVGTLDELRHLVTLLRASGSRGTELTPQPTLADLHTLVGACGIPAQVSGSLPGEITGAAQRAIYRTVQEALTNVRKHAPGASAEIRLWSGATEFGVTIRNGAPTRAAIPLPGSGHGLIGLSERAELLHGRLVSRPAADGGFRVELHLPRN
ncbi:sensor histidine kinase [Nocardia crassostreae]|uniref:sensor histidine kinase n=1 Tax=Nocardia crassostreae TaxID=53428 RepID=UPI00082D846C|nr:histidine kinase [Nocardia crassostreae]